MTIVEPKKITNSSWSNTYAMFQCLAGNFNGFNYGPGHIGDTPPNIKELRNTVWLFSDGIIELVNGKFRPTPSNYIGLPKSGLVSVFFWYDRSTTIGSKFLENDILAIAQTYVILTVVLEI